MSSFNLKKHCSAMYYTQLVLFIKILLLYQGVWGFPVGGDGQGSGDTGNSWILVTALSIGSILTLVLLIFGCGVGGCCGLSEIHWFGRTHQSTPMSFDNPVAEGGTTMTMMTPLSQIDVRALELDPVVFEPLPTIHDLTPLSNQSNNNTPAGQGSGDGPRMSHSQKSLPSVIPFAADDSDLYAHDWFDEPYRNFPRGNIEYVREIGKGWFGQVIEAEARDIVPFARKIRVLVKVLREDASGIEQMRFLDESRLYRDANHGNVLKLLGHSIEKLPFLLIMEHCPQADLKSYLIANVTRAEMLSNQGSLIRMALDIAKGLEWMGSADFIHHDLAARNCQVGSEGRIIIGDYGLGTHIFKDDYYWNSNVAIPLRWAAPETLHCTISTIQTLKVTKWANVWTFAVVIWEIMEFAKIPYFELSDEEVISRVIADKNYFLGQPTLPYIPMKEELYEIMRSCWVTDPKKRPTFSSIVSKLQSLLSGIHLIKSPPRDEFDSKWEQMGRPTSNSFDEDKSKQIKKSVSFTGILNEVKTSEIVEDRSSEVSRKATDANVLSLEVSRTEVKPRDLEGQESLPYPADPEDEHWLHKLERGDIAQKVLEKSHSVQDLMVLTHVEPSELDPDSLPYISRSAEDSTSNNDTTAYEGGISDSSSSPQTYSRENALNSFNTSTSSSTSQISKSNAPGEENLRGSSSNLSFPPDITVLSSSTSLDKTPNRTGIDITLIQPTPNPEISINVIQSTPFPDAKIPDKQTPALSLPSKKANGKTKIKFDFSDTPKSKHIGQNNGVHTSSRRHTSTPKKSGSSPFLLDESCRSKDLFEDVFDTPETTFDTTCNISPISLKSARRGINPGELVSTILVGASDDFGLNPFQGVSSQLNEISILSHETDEEEENDLISQPSFDFNGMSADQNSVLTSCASSAVLNKKENISSPEKTEFDHSPFGADLTVLGQVSNGGAMSLTPHPRTEKQKAKEIVRRALFVEETDSEDNSSKTMFMNSTSIGESSERTAVSAGSWDMINTIKSHANESSWDVLSKGDIGFLEQDSCQTGISLEKNFQKEKESDDGGDFWTQQLQSVQNAADNTRSLFQQSLCGDEEYKIQTDKFVEDIEAANEDLGSLVLHDLEDSTTPEKIVPNTRETVNSPKKEVKLAFLGYDDDSSVALLADESGGNETAVQMWDINNSVELKKSKGGLHSTSEGDQSSIVDDSDGDVEGEGICKEFVPSKWNQTLAPARPAIKSPAEVNPSQSKSSLKKSVSFERKKPQLVYEYPPPPPMSEFEEEDRLHRTSKFPISNSLDWEMTQEDLEDAEIHHEDWDDEVIPKADPMDVYRISGVEEETFHVRGSSEPFVFQPSTLGELRHTRDRLKLDLSRGEASLLDDEATKGAPKKLDSGVGSSTNVSPFNHCDMLPKPNRENQDNSA